MALALLFLRAFIAAIGITGVVAPQTLLTAVRPRELEAGGEGRTSKKEE